MDLLEMLLDQIGDCSAILQVPDGARIIGYLVVVGILDFLLKPELFRISREMRLGWYFSPQHLW